MMLELETKKETKFFGLRLLGSALVDLLLSVSILRPYEGPIVARSCSQAIIFVRVAEISFKYVVQTCI